MIPLTVRAHLSAGIAMSSWGIALDGLLASTAWSRIKADARDAGNPSPGYDTTTVPPDLDLPLGTCTIAGADLWHWAATSAWPEPATDRVDVHTWTAHVDHRELEQVATTLPKVISGRQGRYRTKKMPLVVIPCQSVSWRAIGNPDEISDLLDDVTTIGKKRTTGEGHVLRWEITPEPDLEQYAAAHLHPDGTLGRPCGADCLSGHPMPPPAPSSAGIRPPYLHPARQRALYVPAPLA